MKLVKYFYQWSSDRTVMYIRQVRPSTFLKRPIYQNVSVLYTKDHPDVLAEAESLVERLTNE